LLEKSCAWAFDFLDGFEPGGWGEEAVGRVEDGFLDDWVGDVVGAAFEQVEAGALEAVEEQAGAAEVDVIGCDALEDFAEGLLDGAAVLGDGDGEVGRSGFAGCEFAGGGWAAGGVVVVAEGLVAQAGAAAAAAVDVDVAALEAGVGVRTSAVKGLCGTFHDVPLPWGVLR
jgi:hypothetical protein